MSAMSFNKKANITATAIITTMAMMDLALTAFVLDNINNAAAKAKTNTPIATTEPKACLNGTLDNISIATAIDITNRISPPIITTRGITSLDTGLSPCTSSISISTKAPTPTKPFARPSQLRPLIINNTTAIINSTTDNPIITPVTAGISDLMALIPITNNRMNVINAAMPTIPLANSPQLILPMILRVTAKSSNAMLNGLSDLTIFLSLDPSGSIASMPHTNNIINPIRSDIPITPLASSPQLILPISLRTTPRIKRHTLKGLRVFTSCLSFFPSGSISSIPHTKSIIKPMRAAIPITPLANSPQLILPISLRTTANITSTTAKDFNDLEICLNFFPSGSISFMPHTNKSMNPRSAAIPIRPLAKSPQLMLPIILRTIAIIISVPERALRTDERVFIVFWSAFFDAIMITAKNAANRPMNIIPLMNEAVSILPTIFIAMAINMIAMPRDLTTLPRALIVFSTAFISLGSSFFAITPIIRSINARTPSIDNTAIKPCFA